MRLTRRRVLAWTAGLLAAPATLGACAVGVEPLLLERVVSYRVTPSTWGATPTLRIAVLADLHACEPWMTERRIESIVAQCNALGADLVVLLGDYVAGHRFTTGQVPSPNWSRPLARLVAPLGVYAILGNHDWWADETAQRQGRGPVLGRLALEAAGIRVLENEAVRLSLNGSAFWLAGLADQLALLPGRQWGRTRMTRLDDLPGTLAQIPDGAPVVLLAHEPDIFPQVPPSVALTLSGHTHGGQVRLLGYSPVVPSRFGNRYAYGHVVEEDRHLIVSGGLGCSIAPVRLGVPPEINLVEVAGPALA
ncbi:Phosphoesterase [Rubellimicrobium mesophilum DSM 19309]|uniref:Phosphoesterase n=1 Tax=Rubellimicrobium mesophilum DSM 19309 TaxID=442562 RepID=A0A017HSA8_9RHOB|nr:metallophosphoesterase [Rubellimicrobium mesophilum]EYD77387.1 Phosphoesterase [Rubellimicrobium mesophilum DSM 19309]